LIQFKDISSSNRKQALKKCLFFYLKNLKYYLQITNIIIPSSLISHYNVTLKNFDKKVCSVFHYTFTTNLVNGTKQKDGSIKALYTGRMQICLGTAYLK